MGGALTAHTKQSIVGNATARRVAVGVLSISLTGCAVLQGDARPTTKPIELGSTQAAGQVITFPAHFRGAFLVRVGNKHFLCAEPPPDVAQSVAASLAASLKAPKDQGSAETSASRVATALELSGRSELTLLAREMLYRNCELAINYKGAPPPEVLAHQSKIVDAIVTLAEAELRRAKADQDRARAELLELAATKAQQVELVMRELFDGEVLDMTKLGQLKDALTDDSAKEFLESVSDSTSRKVFAVQLRTETPEVVAALTEALGQL